MFQMKSGLGNPVARAYQWGVDTDAKYPALSDLRARAKRRIPHFAWEYLDSATGGERARARNRRKLDEVLLYPSILHGRFTPDLSVGLLGHRFPLPFGVAPVGMSGPVWPDAECLLARAMAVAGLPYSLSTVAARTPEDVAPVLGGHGWFQLYPPRRESIRRDMLKRARDAGFGVLVLTVDAPVASRRERLVRSGLVNPPRLTPRLLLQALRCPVWALGMAPVGHVAPDADAGRLFDRDRCALRHRAYRPSAADFARLRLSAPAARCVGGAAGDQGGAEPCRCTETGH